MRLTTGCAGFGHPEFELETGSLPQELVDFVVRFVESKVARGDRFLVGQHVQVGSGMLRVVAAGDRLTFHEQVPGTDDWVCSVHRTILSMYRQRCAAESVGLLEQLSFPSPAARAIACNRAEDAEEVGFVRQASSDADSSGWAVLCSDPDHDHDDPDELLATAVRTLAARVRYFDLFLAMPVGSLIIKEGEDVVALMLRGVPLPVLPGSMLDALRQQEGWSL